MKVFISFLFLIVAIESIDGHIQKEFHHDGIHFISKHRKTPFLILQSKDLNGLPKLCEGQTTNEECFIWPDGGMMRTRPIDEFGYCTFNIIFNTIHEILTLPNDVERYGGPEYFEQRWPMNTLRFNREAYVTQSSGNQGIAESYWVTSKGEALFIYNSPAFLTQNDTHLTYEAKVESPYPLSNDEFEFEFVTCIGSDIRNAHELILQYNIIAKPSSIPDALMITHPIWSTWARYKANINNDLVQTFANEILNNGFNNSQLEIDDKWETCYGSLIFDTDRFPDIKQLTDNLKSQGFRVTLWVHPFINLDCPTIDEALEKNYLVSTKDGNTTTNWWNGAGVSVDMTNPEAAEWWAARVKSLRDNDGIDSFKFDAGETSWLPENRYLSHVNDSLQPSEFTRAYVRTCARFGDLIEVRSAAQTQDLGIFVRMLDKDTRWGYDNGLRSLITTLLVMNIQGYPLVLPDMVGGNGYNEVPSKELFIRWLEANTFMPSLQFSYVPWDYDDETIEISKKYTALHAQYSDKIIELAKKATEDGTPINLPLWWIAPTDNETFNIDDEFLLGEDILVAPVVEEGATSRDIYLPEGRWRDELRITEAVGPQWLRNYTVQLSELAYFTRINE